MTARSIRIHVTAGLAALCCLAAGCSSSSKHGAGGGTAGSSSSVSTSGSSPTPSAGTSSSTGSSDFTSLLIGPTDIPVPGIKLTATQAVPGGKGVAGLFESADGMRQVGDTIVVLPDAAAAKTALAAAGDAALKSIAGSSAVDAPVGDEGHGYVGTTAGGTKSSVLVLFTQGNALVSLQFDSPKGDDVPQDVVKTTALKQAAKIKAAPPS